MRWLVNFLYRTCERKNDDIRAELIAYIVLKYNTRPPSTLLVAMAAQMNKVDISNH